MQPPAQTFPVLSFLGVVVQLGGALMLLSTFLLLRRFVLRRAYFSAWATGWGAFAVAIAALVVRYILLPGISGMRDEGDPVVRALYFVYQLSKCVGFVYFARGTVMYVAGASQGLLATQRLWIFAALFAVLSSVASRNGLNEMVIWQAAVAVPALGYCASAILWLPSARRTRGSVAMGAAFALLALLWMAYAGAFALAISGYRGSLVPFVSSIVAFNSYLDLVLNVVLGYSMMLVFMEDAKREVDDAQAELRVTHDQLRRAALYDSLTDSLNRRAFAEGVGLDMIRATFGTVVIADLDYLKQTNDRFGHAAGDQLLRRCADVLRGTLRPYDKLYRWGGDEFLLVVPSARAADVVARLQRAIDGSDPIISGEPGEPIQLAVSLGAADYASSAELSVAIERADRAMYAEKSRRKGAAGVASGVATGERAYASPTSMPVVR